MSKTNKISSIVLISLLVINTLFLLYAGVMAILIGLKVAVFTKLHLILLIIVMALNLLYLIYFVTILLVNKIKTK